MTTESHLDNMRIAFIGCGVMAESIIAGLLRQKLVSPEQIAGSHPRAARREELHARYGIRMVEKNRDAVEGEIDIVVLAVKPQRLHLVLSELRGALSADNLVLSIIAGARIETIAKDLAHSTIVRAMPNTPAQIGEGITVWVATPEVSDEQRQRIQILLGALGREMPVETERMIDMATALSATGPTYVFLVMEALVDAGVHMGFSRHVAQELVTQTILGSVLFARESHKHPAELRNMVTSPGGTSAEAIYQMEKGGLRTVLSKAVYAAFQRAVALGKS
ncbi:MAG TPA: pyrroline-5-carboxylate reductase [Pyrinomonadaceae bacterium]|nr:pyrroline-5-carboxylate reductase [Pyrinomonadaceae bacterium]